MTDIYIPPSNFMVRPYLGIIESTPTFKTNEEVDDIIEGKEEVKKSKFEDEDAVDSDEERKTAAKQAEEAKKNAAPPKVKNKGKDYD